MRKYIHVRENVLNTESSMGISRVQCYQMRIISRETVLSARFLAHSRRTERLWGISVN